MAIIIIILSMFYLGVPDQGVHEKVMGYTNDSNIQQDTVIISGRIFVSGHEPFTVLALEQDDGTAVTLSAADSLYKELWSHQNQIVKCKGKFIPDTLHEKSFYVIEYKKVE